MTEDAELLRRYADTRSEDPFAEFVRRHIDLVYAAALRRTGNAHAAAEIAQHVFLAASRHARSLARHPRLTGWLYAATRNAALNLMRDEHRRHQREQAALAAHDIIATSAYDAEWERLRPMLDEVIDELNDQDREAVLLRFFENRALAEIGARLNVTENTARMRVDRALEKLRTRLAGRGVKSTATALASILAQQSALAAPAGLAASVATTVLSSASTLAGPALGFLQSMSNSKLAASIAGVLVLLALGTATYETMQQRAAETALTDAEKNHAALLARLRDREQRTQAAEREVTQLKTKIESARSTQTAVAPAMPAPVWDNVAEGNAFLARHPEVKQALDVYMVAQTRFRYAGLGPILGATPDQLDRLTAILAQGSAIGIASQEQRSLGKEMMLKAGNGDDGDRELEQMRQTVDAGAQKKFAESFRNANRLVGARDTVVQLASTQWAIGVPPTQEQTQKLIEVLIANRIALPGASAVYDWDKVLTVAAEFLSPDQIAPLADRRARDQFHRVNAQLPASNSGAGSSSKK